MTPSQGLNYKRREKMRLFIAINFNEEIKDVLMDLADDLREQGASGNFVPYDNLHLTLVFLGEVRDDELIIIKDALDYVPFPDINIEINECGNFRDLFWVGTKENKVLNEYVKKLRDYLREDGINFDKKKFKPHITLIRRANFPKGVIIKTPRVSMKCDKASLMQTRFVKNKPVYLEIY